MLSKNLTIDQVALVEFCNRYHVRRMSVFGSALRDDFTSESDVDVLVEFEPEIRMGLEFFGLGEKLSPVFGGRRVDLGTPDSLNRWIRARVVREVQVVYDAA